MKPTNPILATLLLAGTALAADNCTTQGDCNDTSPITDYSTLRRREVGGRNTLVRTFCYNRRWSSTDGTTGLEDLAAARRQAHLVLA